MSFCRYVEIGRVCLITYGPDAGKLATIVDVMDNNRVLVDGPQPLTGVHRHAVNVKRIQLTDIKIGAKLNSSQKCATGRAAATPSLPRAGLGGLRHGNALRPAGSSAIA